MSLEGTLETIALPDVLALLSVTAKTGELRIESGGGVGSVWFDAGRVAGYEVGSHSTAVDALFALLRLKEGHFKFHTGTDPMNPMTPMDVVPVLEEAESRLVQWPAIAAAIPSLYSELRLEDTVDGTVMLRPDQWQLISTIAAGTRVGDILHIRNLGEFDGCKALKELIDVRLVYVASPGTPPPAPSPAPAADLSVSAEVEEEGRWAQEDEVHEVADLSEVWNDQTGDVEAPVAEAETETEDTSAEPVNRGLLLKFLGSARN